MVIFRFAAPARAFAFAFVFLLGFDAQDILVHLKFDIFFLDAGEFHADEIFLCRSGNVDFRREHAFDGFVSERAGYVSDLRRRAGCFRWSL
jgi:hypothetical protein